MKYIKTYEDLHAEPQIGDFVKCDFHMSNPSRTDKLWIAFVNTQIGEIIQIDDEYNKYVAEYYVPEEIYKKCFKSKKEKKFIYERNNKKYIDLNLDLKEIIEFASTLEDIETKIVSKKYNI